MKEQRKKGKVNFEDEIEVNGIWFLGASKVLAFDEAVEEFTTNLDRPDVFATLYQSLTFIFILFGIVSSSPIVFGLSFFTKLPTSYECFKHDSK